MGYIYKITNLVNGHFYIGQTTKTIETRFMQHWRDATSLKCGKESQTVLHRAMRKYGIENFSIEVLEECPDEMLSEKEIFYIDKLNAFYGKDGYNMTFGGNCGTPLKLDWDRLNELWNMGLDTADIATKMGLTIGQVRNGLQRVTDGYSPKESRSRSAVKYHPKIDEKIRKPIDMYDINGNFLMHFQSIRDASVYSGCGESSISVCLHGKRFSTDNRYRWAFAGETPKDFNRRPDKKTTCFDKDGRYICSFPSCGHAARWVSEITGKTCDTGFIRQSSIGKRKTAYGFLWSEESERISILDFVNINKNWEDIIQVAPYNVSVKKDGNYILLKYNESSDFSIELVRQCRGIILYFNGEYYISVARAFDRFFNYSERFADKIDWSTARVQQKVDGSLIKVWFHKDSWHISTNGCIDAYSVTASSISDTYETSHKVNFGELFHSEFVKHCSFDKLNKNYTYMFELVSPEIKVVVDYGKNDIYHLCTRGNKSGKYVEVDIGVQKPKEYPLHSLEACLNAAEKLNSNDSNEITDEGFVVVDGHYRRVKIKSPLYLAAHYLVGNKLSLKRCINIILANEESEYLSYFPEQKSAFDKVHSAVYKLAHTMENGYKFVLDSVGISDRKEVALFIKENKFNYSGFYFKKMEIPELTAEQYMFGGYKKKLQNGAVKESLPLISIRELLKKATENLENREWWRY